MTATSDHFTALSKSLFSSDSSAEALAARAALRLPRGGRMSPCSARRASITAESLPSRAPSSICPKCLRDSFRGYGASTSPTDKVAGGAADADGNCAGAGADGAGMAAGVAMTTVPGVMKARTIR
ncbi:MAG: hypothetical protein IPI44_24745 [Sulfuritalea sp.]|nr:hypothetical protein [Sulfuritalea sp.]